MDGRRVFAILVFLFFASASAEAATEPLLHRGVNLSSWFANAPRQPLGSHDFRQIRDMGFDFVRLPVNPETIGFRFDDPDCLQHLDLQQVKNAIDGLTRAGLAVVVDIHPEKDFMERLELESDAEDSFIALWKTLSVQLKTYPNEQVAFELLNEPQYYNLSTLYNTFIARLVKAIREKEPNRLLIVNSPAVFSSQPVDALKKTALIKDPHVIYDAHFYQPYIITHQGISGAFERKQIRYFNNVPYPSALVDRLRESMSLARGADTDKAMAELDEYIDEKWDSSRIFSYLAPVAKWAEENKVRVVVLEYGVLRTHIDQASRYRWIADTREALDKLGLGWAYWDYSDQFGLMKLSARTTTDDDGAVRFVDHTDSKNTRIPDAEAIQALGLTVVNAQSKMSAKGK